MTKAEYEYLKNRVMELEREKAHVEDEVRRMRDRDVEYFDSDEDDDDDSFDVTEGMFSYDRLEIAQTAIERHVTPEMLETAARAASVRVETIKQVYLEGAMLGISTLHEALLDLIGSAKGTKK